MSKKNDLIRNIGAAKNVAERCRKMGDEEGYESEMDKRFTVWQYAANNENRSIPSRDSFLHVLQGNGFDKGLLNESKLIALFKKYGVSMTTAKLNGKRYSKDGANYNERPMNEKEKAAAVLVLSELIDGLTVAKYKIKNS